MNRTAMRRVWRLCLIIAFVALTRAYAFQSASSSTSPLAASPYRVVRSIAGAAGHEDNNRFIMDDARSLFSAGKDQKVIVYFEWEGPLGPHHFEGLWKSPEGKIVLISDFRYEAKTPHFSGYWTMLLAEGTPSGEWNLEARIDGEPAGSLSFVIAGSAAPAAPTRPQPLSVADLYGKTMGATAVIEKLASDGVAAEKSTGFWVAEGQILTSFESIDGASSLRITLPSGSSIKTDEVLAWNRWQDWALLKVAESPKTFLKRRSAATANVGDRCFFLDWGAVGSKLADGSITGTNSFPLAGSRLLVASGVSSQSVGGALVDEFGEFVGIIGGSIIPSGNPVRILGLLNDSGVSGGSLDLESTGLAVPNSLLPDLLSNATPAKLADLAGRGEFAPLVIKSNAVQFMSVTSAVDRDAGNIPLPRNSKQIFSKRDKKATVYINWQYANKEKITYYVRFFTADNKVMTASKPQQLSLAPGRYSSTTWDFPLASLQPGIYRVDLLINDKTAWREFIRVTD